MISLGLLLVVIGFALIVPRGAVAGSAARRNVTLGGSQLFTTRGYDGTPSTRYRIIRVLLGLAMIAGGVALIATSG